MGAKQPSRLLTRLRTLFRAGVRAPLRRAARPERPQVIGIFHHLLLGDTLMLAGLIKSSRLRWPQARIVCLVPPAIASLFSTHPWGVEVVAYDPRRPATLDAVLQCFAQGLDLALLPGDNRHALLARACGARWIRGFAGDTPAWKNALCDELLAWPDHPLALTEIFASLVRAAGSQDGGVSATFSAHEWLAPAASSSFTVPSGKYAVLHLGASNPLRYWPPSNWLALADALMAQGITPLWSCGPNETHLLDEVDPAQRYRRTWAGTLGLADLWHLLRNSCLTVCLDSGVAHLAKIVGVPTVCLFGQGSDVLFGAGEFFAKQPFVAVIDPSVACRDQSTLFGRTLPWVRRCARRPGECSDPVCIRALTPARVVQQCFKLLEETHDHRQ